MQILCIQHKKCCIKAKCNIFKLYCIRYYSVFVILFVKAGTASAAPAFLSVNCFSVYIQSIAVKIYIAVGRIIIIK